MSVNSERDLGWIIVLISMILGCFSIRRTFNSRRILLANILCSKALVIFFMATIVGYIPYSGFIRWSITAATAPYAPTPTALETTYLSLLPDSSQAARRFDCLILYSSTQLSCFNRPNTSLRCLLQVFLFRLWSFKNLYIRRPKKKNKNPLIMTIRQ